MDEAAYIQALIQLHDGLQRQGPGDLTFSRAILESIQGYLPPAPRIADLGCGTGASSLFLAQHLQARVRAVDLSTAFLATLSLRAKAQGLSDWIEVIEADMGQLHWEPASIDLIWSEGAAYNLTFQGALKAWHPLLAQGGIAVISEMTYFTPEAPEPVARFWHTAYPTMATESDNIATAQKAGFEVIETRALPSQAWWENYYNPLKVKIKSQAQTDNEVMQAVIAETEKEMDLFEQYADHYGYSFYLLKAL